MPRTGTTITVKLGAQSPSAQEQVQRRRHVAAEREIAGPAARLLAAQMDLTALAIMLTSLAYSGFVVLAMSR